MKNLSHVTRRRADKHKPPFYLFHKAYPLIPHPQPSIQIVLAYQIPSYINISGYVSLTNFMSTPPHCIT